MSCGAVSHLSLGKMLWAGGNASGLDEFPNLSSHPPHVMARKITLNGQKSLFSGGKNTQLPKVSSSARVESREATSQPWVCRGGGRRAAPRAQRGRSGRERPVQTAALKSTDRPGHFRNLLLSVAHGPAAWALPGGSLVAGVGWESQASRRSSCPGSICLLT